MLFCWGFLLASPSWAICRIGCDTLLRHISRWSCFLGFPKNVIPYLRTCMFARASSRPTHYHRNSATNWSRICQICLCLFALWLGTFHDARNYLKRFNSKYFRASSLFLLSPIEPHWAPLSLLSPIEPLEPHWAYGLIEPYWAPLNPIELIEPNWAPLSPIEPHWAPKRFFLKVIIARQRPSGTLHQDFPVDLPHLAPIELSS